MLLRTTLHRLILFGGGAKEYVGQVFFVFTYSSVYLLRNSSLGDLALRQLHKCVLTE